MILLKKYNTKGVLANTLFPAVAGIGAYTDRALVKNTMLGIRWIGDLPRASRNKHMKRERTDFPRWAFNKF